MLPGKLVPCVTFPIPPSRGLTLPRREQGIGFINVLLTIGSEECVLMSLSLLDVMLSGLFTIAKADYPLLDALLPLLEPLQRDKNPSVASLAEDTRISIATRDRKWASATGDAGDAPRDCKGCPHSSLPPDKRPPLLPPRG